MKCNTRWCQRRELNPQAVRHTILSRACLPISPLWLMTKIFVLSVHSSYDFNRYDPLPMRRHQQSFNEPHLFHHILFVTRNLVCGLKIRMLYSAIDICPKKVHKLVFQIWMSFCTNKKTIGNYENGIVTVSPSKTELVYSVISSYTISN